MEFQISTHFNLNLCAITDFNKRTAYGTDARLIGSREKKERKKLNWTTTPPPPTTTTPGS